jgi:penicillin-binding protein 2
VLKGQRAAVVVVDPRDGGVLAMVSSPSYDPNPFVKGIGYQAYKSLLDNPDRPLINRVTQGYILRLRRKPYMALSALSAGRHHPEHHLLRRADVDAAGHATPLPRLAENRPRHAQRDQSHRRVGGHLFLSGRLRDGH